jgi:endonuclease YncB( thermonuclease family)
MQSITVDEIFENLEDKDNINPNHYRQGDVECIDALEAATIRLNGIDAVCTANAIKYLWRWKEKNGTEDLKKAQWYINRLIDIHS